MGSLPTGVVMPLKNKGVGGIRRKKKKITKDLNKGWEGWDLTHLYFPVSSVTNTIGSMDASSATMVTLTPASLGVMLPSTNVPCLPSSVAIVPGQASWRRRVLD